MSTYWCSRFFFLIFLRWSSQALMHDTSRKRVMALLVHGDASFSGLGIVPEVSMLSQRF